MWLSVKLYFKKLKREKDFTLNFILKQKEKTKSKETNVISNKLDGYLIELDDICKIWPTFLWVSSQKRIKKIW